ncbi:hypothetical protein PV-S19_0013 [Pacmanvirus S19]|nr:hypothetical protein PV-S19_0013 [Pacmanvirus S19]
MSSERIRPPLDDLVAELNQFIIARCRELDSIYDREQLHKTVKKRMLQREYVHERIAQPTD